jgi:hypothetical protein
MVKISRFMPVIRAFFIFMLVFAYISIFIPQPAQAVVIPWYDSGYSYRKQFTVTGSTAGAQTNYQVKLSLLYSGNDSLALNVEPASGTYAMDAGTNTTTVVDAALTSTTDGYYVGCYVSNVTRGTASIIIAYAGSTKTATISPAIASQTTADAYFVTPRAATINLDSKVQADFDDIRFTKSDGITPLDYWLENKTNSSIATVWIELDSVPASPLTNTFYIYYGNSVATYAGNGTNTFITFDDFERGIDGGAIGGIWTATSGAISTDHNYTTLTNTGIAGTRSAKIAGSAGVNNIIMSKVAGSNYAVSNRFWKENASIGSPFIQGNGTNFLQINVDATENVLYYGAPGTPVDTLYNIVADAWTYFDIKKLNFSTATALLTIDNYRYETVVMIASASYANTIGVYEVVSGAGNDIYLDDFIIRTIVVQNLWLLLLQVLN